jgi:hypothetical protein
MKHSEDWLKMVSISEPIFDENGRYVWEDISNNDPIEDIIIHHATKRFGYGSFEAANLVKNDILKHRSSKTGTALGRIIGCEI